MNYNLTPDISIQYYGSPFISSGIYNGFSHSADAASRRLSRRSRAFDDSEINYNVSTNQYVVTDGSVNYTFDRPDFSFREFRSNLVARWEYRPGSTIYLVWENRRQSRENVYSASYGHNLGEMMQVTPTNVFMVKMSFWLGL